MSDGDFDGRLRLGTTTRDDKVEFDHECRRDELPHEVVPIAVAHRDSRLNLHLCLPPPFPAHSPTGVGERVSGQALGFQPIDGWVFR